MSVIIDQNNLQQIIDNWNGFLIETRDALANMILRSIIQRFPAMGPAWQPLHPFTISQKGSSAMLVDTGHLRNSITVHEQDVGSLRIERRIGVFIYQGYHNQEMQRRRYPQTTPTDILLTSLAVIHEFGAVIEVTPRMRSFLHRVGLHLRATTRFIVIPERSFLRNGFDRIEPEIVPNIVAALNVYMLKHAVEVV